MSRYQSFREFLTKTEGQIGLSDFILNFLLAALLGFILGLLYVKFGRSLSNRKKFAMNFMLLTLTTMLVISIVKSSLALSLGLVGALSIVRFRSAIKEPEELMYLFLAISIGLGFGAGQRVVTVLAFILITILIIIQSLFHKTTSAENLYLNVTGKDGGKLTLPAVLDVLKKYCVSASLTRLDDADSMFEAAFMVKFRNVENLSECRSALKELDEKINISFMENKGVL
ncbi:MAG: DUF4956 domain-containing protein [Planctomycetota bacterium]|jgi:hypothetical protein